MKQAESEGPPGGRALHRTPVHRTAPQRVRISACGVELGTGPDLVRAEFGFACRRTDARRHEPVQGRATTREQLRNVRNVVALPSPRLQLLRIYRPASGERRPPRAPGRGGGRGADRGTAAAPIPQQWNATTHNTRDATDSPTRHRTVHRHAPSGPRYRVQLSGNAERGTTLSAPGSQCLSNQRLPTNKQRINATRSNVDAHIRGDVRRQDNLTCQRRVDRHSLVSGVQHFPRP